MGIYTEVNQGKKRQKKKRETNLFERICKEIDKKKIIRK